MGMMDVDRKFLRFETEISVLNANKSLKSFRSAKFFGFGCFSKFVFTTRYFIIMGSRKFLHVLHVPICLEICFYCYLIFLSAMQTGIQKRIIQIICFFSGNMKILL